MKIKPNLYIFSVYQGHRPRDRNKDNHKALLEGLRGLDVPYKELLGRYKGQGKRSILIAESEGIQALVEDICQQFNQECYLYSHNDRSCDLVYPDGTRQSIGTLQSVSKEEARLLDAYSYDPVTRQYWAVV